MSEAGDYVPAPHWQGTIDNFKSARAAYDDHRKRSYDDAVQANVSVDDCVPDSVETDSEAPLVISCDVTGSMGTWPGVMFSKLPYLEYEAQEYLGDGVAISFSAFGDAPRGDIYALQVRPFAKGKEMKEQLEKLIPKQNGFGNQVESADLAAYYYAYNCRMPEAIRKPIFIFITDEGIYETAFHDDVKKWAKFDNKKVSVKEAFEKLKEKFSVYCVLKPYNESAGDGDNDTNSRIRRQWHEMLGDDHVADLPAADRVVDVIFGILAKETGRIEYFEKELQDRQGKDADGKQKIAVVLKSLMTMHKLPKESLKKLEGPKGAKSKSVTPSKAASKKAGSSKSISLLDE